MITMTYLGDRKDAVQFVSDLTRFSNYGFQSITIISQEKLEGYFVRIVTDTLSVDILDSLAQAYSLEPMDI